MKRIKYLVIATAMLTQMVAPVYATNTYKEVLNELDIMTYYNGDFNENGYVTRAMMSKILVMSSDNKNSVVQTNISPFYDVVSSHWCSPYVNIAVNNTLMRGYLDGSFKPEDYIKTEEAITGALNLLGYTDFLGTYPVAQMTLAQNIGILDGVNATAGNAITRDNLAKIMYNTLNTENKSGVLHSKVLGYDSDELTLEDILDEEDLDPIFVTTAQNYTGYKIYVDGKSATSVPANSIVYVDAQTVYAYTKTVVGVIDSISPNVEQPTSITISGKTYSLSTDIAKDAVSFDGFEVNEYITCVLDKNGDVGAILGFTAENLLAVVISTGVRDSGYFANVIDQNGNIYDVTTSENYESFVGKLVTISSDGKLARKYNVSTMSGEYNSDNMTFGTQKLSNNVTIIDIDNSGEAIVLTKDRLNGATIASTKVMYTEVNENDEISTIILNDVTNDADSYVYITNIVRNESDKAVSSVYTYDLSGKSTVKNVASLNKSIEKGASKLDAGSDFSIKNLTEETSSFKSLSSNKMTFENGTVHTLSNDVVVYKMVDSTPVISDINDVDLKLCTYYYDNTQKNAGAIRVIIEK